MGPDGLFVSKRTGSHSPGIHVPFTNCFVCRWFCVVHDPKPPLHSHNWLSFGKFQDTIHCERHFSSRLPPSGGTWKYAKAPSTKKLGEILYLLICSFLPCLSWLLRSRVRKSRRDLWITLYISMLLFVIASYVLAVSILRYPFTSTTRSFRSISHPLFCLVRSLLAINAWSVLFSHILSFATHLLLFYSGWNKKIHGTQDVGVVRIWRWSDTHLANGSPRRLVSDRLSYYRE